MAQPSFQGVINVDIRDSVPDWAPFEPPKAPEGAPNVVYIVLDDVGFSAMSCYGGPIETPNIDRIAAEGVRYTQWHTTALCSPTRSCLLTGRNHTRNSMACITEAAIGFPNASGTIPPENGMLPEILGELGWNTYMVGKWHLCPDRRDEPRLHPAQLADRPRVRALVRVPRRRDQPVVSGPGLRQPPGRPAQVARGGLPPHRGPHRQGDRVHQGRQGDRAGEAVLPVLRARAPATRRTTPRRSGSTGTRAGSTWATRRCASRPWPARRRWGSCPPDTELPPINPIGTPETRTGPDGKPFPPLDVTRPWDSLSDDEKRLFARMAEVYAGFLAHADHHIGRLLDYLEETGQRENTLVIVVSDNGASGEGGPNGSVNEMKFVNGIPDDIESNLAMLDELGGPKTYNHYPNGWAMAFNTPFKMWKRYEFNGGTADPCIISWPAGHEGAAARSATSTTTRSTSCRPSSTCSASSRPETIKGHVQSRFDGVSMRYSFDDAVGTVGAKDAVLLDARLARHLARRLEGGHDPPDDQRLEQLQRRRVGAVPHRCRPLGAARPRRRAPRQAPRAGQPLVRGGGRQRRVPARRPLGARDLSDAAAAARRRRATATSTSPTPPRSPSRRRSTSATARTRSARWSTSPRPAPRACCSPTARGSAATPSTSRTTGCTTSTTSSACSSRRSTPPRTCRPART